MWGQVLEAVRGVRTRSARAWSLAWLVMVAGCPSASSGDREAYVADAEPDVVFADAASDAVADAEVDAPLEAEASISCPPEMVAIGAFCIDRYEAYVVQLDAAGREHPHSPLVPVDGLEVRAKVARGVVPQGYISQKQSANACANAGKRLCSADEFERACRGPDATNVYPYGGNERRVGYCNEGKGSSVARLFGPDFSKRTYAEFNDPRLSAWPGTLAKTGAFARCVSPEGVFDLVGNLHEWGSDAADERGRARFRGGFYGDAEVNGHGCAYVTKAHEPTYHDYSTGFRCCVDGAAAPRSIGAP